MLNRWPIVLLNRQMLDNFFSTEHLLSWVNRYVVGSMVMFQKSHFLTNWQGNMREWEWCLPAGWDEVEECCERLVLVRRVGVEEAEGHHGAARLVQHHHVDATPARLGGVLQDLWVKLDIWQLFTLQCQSDLKFHLKFDNKLLYNYDVNLIWSSTWNLTISCFTMSIWSEWRMLANLKC